MPLFMCGTTTKVPLDYTTTPSPRVHIDERQIRDWFPLFFVGRSFASALPFNRLMLMKWNNSTKIQLAEFQFTGPRRKSQTSLNNWAGLTESSFVSHPITTSHLVHSTAIFQLVMTRQTCSQRKEANALKWRIKKKLSKGICCGAAFVDVTRILIYFPFFPSPPRCP